MTAWGQTSTALLMVGALLGAWPRSANAQGAEESVTLEPNAEEAAPSSEPAPEEPALQLKLDDAGVEVAPTPARTFGGYTLEELELRKRRAAFGLIAPAITTVAGIALLVFGTSGDCYNDAVDNWDYRNACRRPRVAGAVLTSVGGAGLIAGSVLAARRAKEFRQAGVTPAALELQKKKRRRRLGLGIGLGVGLPLVVGLTAGGVVMSSNLSEVGEPHQ